MSDFQTKFHNIPTKARKRGVDRVFIYSGASMQPTFRPGQLLYVRPISQDLAKGDVVVYFDQKLGRYVVHRVVAAKDGLFTTRGDNNLSNDETPLAYGQLVGQVESADYGGRIRQVAGARRSLWAAQLHWTMQRIWTRLYILLGKPYQKLKTSASFHQNLVKLFNLEFEFIRFQTPDGLLLKVLRHKRVVLRFQPEAKLFVCRKPYDLFLLESDLRQYLKDTPLIKE